MRVSDVERQRVVDELRRHCAAGRIDMDDYSGRVEKAMRSSTLQELDEVRADLPMLRISEPARATAPAGSGSASLSVHQRDMQVLSRRLPATLFTLFSTVMVLAAIGVGVFESWGWALVVIGAWLVGIAQGRLTRVLRT